MLLFLRKVDPNLSGDDRTMRPILLTPLPDRIKEEVLNLLNQIGANQIEKISAGFISAEVPNNAIPLLEELACVEIKHPYQMR
jgi:hypothetical protein